MSNIPDCCYDYRYEQPQAQIVDTCDICGEGIYEGEEYYNICEMNICEDCILDFKKTAEI
ncbi:hypothetical protein CLLI_22270 [Clostridium liquoris]|jgi:ribosome-binding protein aMBF1 (putative translation factor)|uniref:Inhibitor of sigma-G Gin n=1 Tax=Clostridium liquoris TaxID=1289519 RepID=A0A2T0B1H5_9CLOT|nr:hypothetical protein [Clostridium liquoris]PRR77663.1 hypothetical protein CLLI_22270 [Clostridium liquoris]